MEEIRTQYTNVERAWDKAYRAALSNPAAWQPHLPNTDLAIVDEAVEALGKWINRSRAPKGYSPGYHLAKSLAGTQLPNLLSAAQQLQAGNYNHFPAFVNHLVTALSAIHAMVVYAPKSDQRSINADFTAELAQSLSLLNTAQKELAEKRDLLSSAQELVDEIEAYHENITKILASASADKESLEATYAAAEETTAAIRSQLNDITARNTESSEIIERLENEYKTRLYSCEEKFKILAEEHQEEYAEILESHNKEYERIIKDNKYLNDNLHAMTDEVARLQEECRKQEELINSILPRGASAGLAAAFASRGKQLEPTKRIWLTVFVSSLVALSAFAWHITNMTVPEGTTFWDLVLTRLPLAAPLVWIGWFSAIQYGNIIRVQEDYAFKEATSKAYQGYKDHMKHLGNVALDEAQTALTLLSETTINVLGREPLRIYGKTEHDASPTHSLAQLIRREKSKKIQQKQDDQPA